MCCICLKKKCICQKIINEEIEEIGFLTKKRSKTKTKKIELSLFETSKEVEAMYITKMLSAAKKRAEKKNLEFNLKNEDIEIPRYCPVLGIPLYSSKLNTDNSPSIDRIDNKKGYIKDNIQIISTRANRIKNDSSFEEIEKLYLFLREKKFKKALD
jgi:hypothetical protein